jgi:hypothetical protein
MTIDRKQHWVELSGGELSLLLTLFAMTAMAVYFLTAKCPAGTIVRCGL